MTDRKHKVSQETPKKKGPSAETVRYVLRRLWVYLKPQLPLFVLAICLTLLANQLSLMGPLFSGDAIDAIAAVGGVDFGTVWHAVGRMLVCYVCAALLSYLLSVLMIFISQRVVFSMRKSLFEKLTTLPVSYFDTHAPGDIISRISYDIDTVNASLSHDVVQVMTSLYTVIGSLIFMWRISKPMILVFFITVPASLLFTRFRARRIRPLMRARSGKLGELNGYAEEMLTGCATIRAYHKEDVIGQRFAGRNRTTMDAYYKADYYGCLHGPVVNLINNLSVTMVTVLGGILYMLSTSGAVRAGSLFFISLGGVAQFVQYSRKFAGPINEFANIISEFQSAFAAADRVFRIIDEEPEAKDGEGALSCEHPEGWVELDEVDFSYLEGKPVLYDVSFEAAAGKTVALVGPTGSGKTTVINLLMRFYDVCGGRITLDGTDLRDLKRDSLRHAYTMVLQDTWLFHGTVYENIVYGKENATYEEVMRAAKAARIDSFIERLPDGYDTLLSDDGTSLSKGQKQLITIARAMLSDAPMLILDEATSNVDSRTEIKISEAMAELSRGRTCFVIAHRLSTIRNADLILVLQSGRITERGTHDQLMARGGFYHSLFSAQFD